MAQPYLVSLRIQYPSGTNLANVNVTVRVESTNESATKTTNSAGEVIFNLGNADDFPSGYAIGDKFSWVVIYQGFESFSSQTIAATGGYTNTAVVLTAVATAPSLRYFTVQEFLDYFDLKIKEDDGEKGVKSQQVVKIGQMEEARIDEESGTKFDSGNAFTEYVDTDEFQDWYHLSKIPIQSITNLYTTQNDSSTTPDYDNNTTEWTSLTEGTDFVVDTTTGRVQIVNSSYKPITRKWGLYAVGTYGRSSVPQDIKELAIIATGLKIMGAAFITSKIAGSEEALEDLTWYTNFRRNVIGSYRGGNIGSYNS